MKNKNAKVLVVGLDGATWKILDPLIKNSKLKFLKKIKKTSQHGKLISVIPPITAPAWSSFMTGVNPGKHGIFDWYKKHEGIDAGIYNSDDIKSDKIWHYLARNGKKSLIINLPMTYPPRPLDGTMVTSFLTPVGEKYYYPERIGKILSRHKYEIDIMFDGSYGKNPTNKLSDKQKSRINKKLIQIEKKRVSVFKKLSLDQDYDFHFICFKGGDFVQHMYYDDTFTKKYWIALDKVLEDLYTFFNEKLDGKKYVFFVSDHGFHKIASLQFSPSLWLEKELGMKSPKSTKTRSWLFLNKLHKVSKRLGFNLTKLDKIKSLRDEIVKSSQQEQEKLIKRSSSFYAGTRGIYFYKKISKEKKHEIVVKLRLLTYEGKRVFKQVSLREKIYKGRYIKFAPDIVWIPDDNFSINLSLLATEIFGKRESELRGEHFSDREGIFLFKGYKVSAGRQEDRNLIDIFPTILSIFDIPVSKFLDGEPFGPFAGKKIPETQYLDYLVNKHFLEARHTGT